METTEGKSAQETLAQTLPITHQNPCALLDHTHKQAHTYTRTHMQGHTDTALLRDLKKKKKTHGDTTHNTHTRNSCITNLLSFVM